MISIGEIATALTGYPFDSKLFNETKGFPLIRIRNLKEGKTDTFFDGDFDRDFLIRKGDLLIGMDGEFNLVEWQSDDALLNQRVMKVIPNEKLVSKSYLKYALPKRLKEIEDSTPFVTVKHLSHKKVLDSKIPLPDLQTQQKIAGILAEADAARQKRKQANQLTEQFLQSAFLEMFGDPVRNEKGWKVRRLDESCEHISVGFVGTCERFYTDESGVPLFRTGNLGEHGIILDNLKYVTRAFHETNKKSQVTGGDILIARHGDHGKACLIGNEIQEANCLNVVVIKVDKTNYVPVVLQYIFNSGSMRSFMEKKSAGATQKVINTKQIQGFIFPIPPLPLQQRFAALVEQTERLRTKQRESERELDNLFQSLMQRYFG